MIPWSQGSYLCVCVYMQQREVKIGMGSIFYFKEGIDLNIYKANGGESVLVRLQGKGTRSPRGISLGVILSEQCNWLNVCVCK